MKQSDGVLHRVGWLFTQLDESGRWSAQMFWSFALSQRINGIHMPPCPSALLLCFDPHAADIRAALQFDDAPGLPPYARQLSEPDDWQGEVTFLLATLALLNSRNAAEVSEAVEPAGNKRRRLCRKRLLFSYHWLRIPQRYKLRHISADGEPSGIQLRAHFVRGHFKVRRTGVFFWSAYQRGNPALGFAHKDYVLTHEARP